MNGEKIKPFNFREQKVHLMPSRFSRLKNGLTFIKEQDSIVDLGLSEDELEVLPSTHGAQRWEINQQNLCEKGQGAGGGEGGSRGVGRNSR